MFFCNCQKHFQTIRVCTIILNYIKISLTLKFDMPKFYKLLRNLLILSLIFNFSDIGHFKFNISNFLFERHSLHIFSFFKKEKTKLGFIIGNFLFREFYCLIIIKYDSYQSIELHRILNEQECQFFTFSFIQNCRPKIIIVHLFLTSACITNYRYSSQTETYKINNDAKKNRPINIRYIYNLH